MRRSCTPFRGPILLAAIAGVIVTSQARATISLGQVDDFQEGTTAGWTQGGPSPNPTSVIASGGPGGAGDAYLQNISSGPAGPGSKQIMFNTSQWTGNYVAAGVTRITAEMANFGANPLFMRLAINDGSAEFGSTTAVSLPVDGGQWHPVTFDLSTAGMSLISGSDTLAQALASVIQLRILSVASGPSFNGDTVAATLGVDDIVAAGSPSLFFTGSAGNGNWNINSTTNWTTTGTDVLVYHDGDNVTFDDTHNAGPTRNITLIAGPDTPTNAGSISPTSITVNTANTYTFGGAGIAGTGSLTKTGIGALFLNSADTASGATLINQGTVTIGTSGSLSASAVTVGNATTSAVLNIAANTSSTAGFLARSFASLSITSSGVVNLASAVASAGPMINTNRTVLIASALSIDAGGTLNLGSNDMILSNGTLGTVSAAGSVTNLIAQGRGANGLWAGSGITSTSASATPATTALGVESDDNGSGGTFFTTFDGQSVTSTDVLVKFTFVGDADLSGTVNATDYSLIDNGFNSQTGPNPLTGWRNGDFNYDGLINGDDYTLIDNAFNTQGSTSFASTSASPGSGELGRTAEMIAADTDQIATPTPVPEPTSFSLLVGSSIMLKCRRRRFNP